MSQRVAAVIVTYNRLEKLKTVLRTVRAQTTPPDWIVVIDNASNDGTKEFLAAQDDPALDVTRLEENTGGAGGFATGTKRAYDLGADLFWLMDDDCYPEPEALERLGLGVAVVVHEPEQIGTQVVGPLRARREAAGAAGVLLESCDIEGRIVLRGQELLGAVVRGVVDHDDPVGRGRLRTHGAQDGLELLEPVVGHDDRGDALGHAEPLLTVVGRVIVSGDGSAAWP